MFGAVFCVGGGGSLGPAFSTANEGREERGEKQQLNNKTNGVLQYSGGGDGDVWNKDGVGGFLKKK